MRLASLICPGCRTPYQLAVEMEAVMTRCPFCGRRNRLPAATSDGLCVACRLPIDDHRLTNVAAPICPR